MKKTNIENNYGTLTRNMQLLIDESFAEKVIPANDSVRLLDQIVEEVDLRPLERAQKRTGRKHRTTPVTMLKIILYAAMERSYSSRAICRFRSELLAVYQPRNQLFMSSFIQTENQGMPKWGEC